MPKYLVSAPRDYEPWSVEFLIEEPEAQGEAAPIVESPAAEAPAGPSVLEARKTRRRRRRFLRRRSSHRTS